MRTKQLQLQKFLRRSRPHPASIGRTTVGFGQLLHCSQYWRTQVAIVQRCIVIPRCAAGIMATGPGESPTKVLGSAVRPTHSRCAVSSVAARSSFDATTQEQCMYLERADACRIRFRYYIFYTCLERRIRYKKLGSGSFSQHDPMGESVVFRRVFLAFCWIKLSLVNHFKA